MVAYPVEHDPVAGTARFRSKPVSAVQRREACSLALEAVAAAGGGAPPPTPAPTSARERRMSDAGGGVGGGAGGSAAPTPDPPLFTTRVLCWRPSAVSPTQFMSLVAVTRSSPTTPTSGGGGGAAGGAGRPAGTPTPEGSPARLGLPAQAAAATAARLRQRRSSLDCGQGGGEVEVATWLVAQTWEIEQPGVAQPQHRRLGFGSLLVAQVAVQLEDGSAVAAAAASTAVATAALPAAASASAPGDEPGAQAYSCPAAPPLGCLTWASLVYVSPECVSGLGAVEATGLFLGRCAVRLAPATLTVFPKDHAPTPVPAPALGDAARSGAGPCIVVPLAAAVVSADGEESIGSVARPAGTQAAVDLNHVSATIPFTRYRCVGCARGCP
jgi:hypothetical protein